MFSKEVSVVVLSMNDFLPSPQTMCGYVIESYICDMDYSTLVNPQNPYSIPAMVDSGVSAAQSFWGDYTLNAIGVSGNVSLGYNVFQSAYGIDALYLIGDRSLAVYVHGGPAPGLGGGIIPSVAGIVGFNIDGVNDYEGGSQSIQGRGAAMFDGITAGYSWPAFKKPFGAGDPQSLAIGPAVGAGASLNYSAQGYVNIFYYSFR